MSLTIIEVLGRSEQGITRPFLCRGDDDLLYYAKGRFAGKKALCCEWVAGRLGKLLELPVPDFAMATVPETLVRYSAMTDIAELDSGLVFASQLVEDAQEFAFNDLGRIYPELQRKVLLFDWWIHNADRTLTEAGGNPNLLWAAQGGGLRVFDLNLAFDESFDEARFWQTHVFNGVVPGWPEKFRREMTERMEAGVAALPGFWAELPKEWLYVDGDSALPPQLSFDAVDRLLTRFRNNPDPFWTVRK